MTDESIITNEQPEEIWEANLIRRNGAAMVDAIIAFGATASIAFALPPGVWLEITEWVNSILVSLFVFVVYRFIALFSVGHTIGMWMCQLRLMNADIEPLSNLEKCCAACFVLVDDVAYYTLKDLQGTPAK